MSSARQERLDDPAGDRLYRYEHAFLAGEFGQQAAVTRMDPGHHRRLVIGKLSIIRQVLAVGIKRVEQPRPADDGEDHDQPDE